MSNGLTCPLIRDDEAAAIQRYGRAPRTHAVPALAVGSTRDAWLELRRHKVGGSEMSMVLDRNPYNSRFSLWWQKFNGWEIEATFEMRVGTMLENTIGDLFAERFPEAMLFRPGADLWAHPDYPHMVVTPDFLAVFSDDPTRVIPIECKSDQTSKDYGLDGTPDVPEHHRIQLLCQAVTFGSPLGYVAHLQGKRFSVHPVPVTPEALSEYVNHWTPEASRFVASLEAGYPPDIEGDGHKATSLVLDQLYANADPALPAAIISTDLALMYQHIRAELNTKRYEYQALQNEIRYAMGNAMRAVDEAGQPVARRIRFKRAGYEVPPAEIDSLRPDARGKTSGDEGEGSKAPSGGE